MVASVDLEDNDAIFEKLQEVQKYFEMPGEYLYFVALLALFPPNRNIVKKWKNNEVLFLKLVKKTGKLGREHFMQALVLFFIRKYNDELSKYAQTFLKKMVDEDVLSEQFILDWNDKNIRLDKDSALYDKKAEKKFRDLVEKFIEWLR